MKPTNTQNEIIYLHKRRSQCENVSLKQHNDTFPKTVNISYDSS